MRESHPAEEKDRGGRDERGPPGPDVKAALPLFHKTGVRTRSQLIRIAPEQYGDQL